MPMRASCLFAAFFLAATPALAQPAPPPPPQNQPAPPTENDNGPHTVHMVKTEDGVMLQVLDFGGGSGGGSGPPLIFLGGLGSSGHVFDKFSQRFIKDHHVWSITRRGYGASSRPDPAYGNYSADQLGDDVLTVMDQLHIDRPVLAAWSMGGEEASSVASRFPQKAAGVVYLDAAYAYAYYAPANMDPPAGNGFAIVNAMRRKMMDMTGPGVTNEKVIAGLESLLKNDLPQLRDHLEARLALQKTLPPAPPLPDMPPALLATLMAQAKVGQAVIAGEQEYGSLSVPVLAIYASPHALPPSPTPQMTEIRDKADKEADALIRRYQAGNPEARVVRIANAQHAVFLSNPDDVEKEMQPFLAGLPKP